MRWQMEPGRAGSRARRAASHSSHIPILMGSISPERGCSSPLIVGEAQTNSYEQLPTFQILNFQWQVRYILLWY